MQLKIRGLLTLLAVTSGSCLVNEASSDGIQKAQPRDEDIAGVDNTAVLEVQYSLPEGAQSFLEMPNAAKDGMISRDLLEKPTTSLELGSSGDALEEASEGSGPYISSGETENVSSSAEALGKEASGSGASNSGSETENVTSSGEALGKEASGSGASNSGGKTELQEQIESDIAIRSGPLSFFRKLRRRIANSRKAKCLKLKEEGEIPQARHSPLSAFGYAHFDQYTRESTVRPGLTLSKVNGFLTPIRVGSQDYTIQGTPDQVSTFLECFSDYGVIGSVLNPEGVWDNTPQSLLPLSIQVENTGTDPYASGAVILARYSIDKLLKVMQPANIVRGEVLKALKDSAVVGPRFYQLLVEKYRYLEEAASQLYTLMNVLEAPTQEIIDSWAELASMKTYNERATHFYHILMRTKAKKAISKLWSGRKNVDVGKKLTVTLTMYPRPDSEIRATRHLHSSTVLVRDVQKAFLELFGKWQKDSQSTEHTEASE